LVVLPDGGGFGDRGVEDLPHKLAEVESLLGGVIRRVVLGSTRGLSHTSLLFGLVANGPVSESEEMARTRLADAFAVCRVTVGKACKLKIVVRASPPTSGACRWRHGGIEGPFSEPAGVRPWGILGRSQGCSTQWRHRDACKLPRTRGCPLGLGRRPWPVVSNTVYVLVADSYYKLL
jgi:hypothetical protein